MPVTLADIRDNVMLKLTRSDAATRDRVTEQIKAAVRYYRRMPWHFSEVRNGTLTTNAGEAWYDAIDFTDADTEVDGLASVSLVDVINIDAIRSPNNIDDFLAEVDYQRFLIMQQGILTSTSVPDYYTRYAQRIGLYPTPSQPHQIEVSATVRPLIPTSDSSTSVFFEEAQDMIEEYAAEKVAGLYLRNPTKASEHRNNRLEQERALSGERAKRSATNHVRARN